MIYYAKSADEHGDRLTNREHLQQVSALACRFGAEVGMPLCGEMAGLLHDFGKYSQAFQRVLDGTASNIDHAVCAAVLLCGCGAAKKRPYSMVACVTAAHHSYLQSYDTLVPSLRELLTGKGSGTSHAGKQAALFGPAGVPGRMERLFAGSPGLSLPGTGKIPGGVPAGNHAATRMLFSCLVDADYTASAGRSPRRRMRCSQTGCSTACMSTCRPSGRVPGRTGASTPCGMWCSGSAAKPGTPPRGLFTLTAPTGVGKTLALLHFCAAPLCGKRKAADHFGPAVPYADRTESKSIRKADPPYPGGPQPKPVE